MSGTERRRAQRVKKHIMVQYRKSSEVERWDMTEALDFSEVGILITAAEAIEVDIKLHLRIKLPLNPLKWYEFDSRVVACHENIRGFCQNYQKDSYLVRLEIVGLEPEAKDLIRQCVIYYSKKL